MRKSVSALLIFSVILSFCIFSFPVSAALTETYIIGGIITAFAGAAGAYIAGDQATDGQLSQYLYDSFVSYWKSYGRDNAVALTIAGTAIEKGKLKIDAEVSNLLSEFVFNKLNGVTESWKTIQVNGYDLVLPTANVTSKYNRSPYYIFSDNFNWFSRYTPLVIGDTTITFDDSSYGYLYINGVKTLTNNSSDIRNTSNLPVQSVIGDVRLKVALYASGNSLCIVQMTNYYREKTNDYPDKYTSVWGSNYNLQNYISESIKNVGINTDSVISLPSETIQDGEYTYITIGSDIQIKSVDDFAQAALEQTVDGTLTAEYENAVTLDPIAPETHLGWITSLHGIWYYVQHLIETGTNGIKRIAQIQNAIPQETLFCIYGGVVLLLFGGVISRLLL